MRFSRKTPRRIFFVDEIRGISILCVVFYHAVYLGINLFSMDFLKPLFNSLKSLQFLFACIFIAVSGVCTQFSRSNLTRGLKIFLLSLGISFATLIFVPKERIVFGILHFLACSLIIYSLLESFFNRISPILGALFFLFLFVWASNVPMPMNFLYLPDFLAKEWFLLIIGARENSIYSADYFPLYPWITLFLFGVFTGKIIKRALHFSRVSWLLKSNLPVFSMLGRNSLPIYLFHQPILYGVFWIFSYFFK